MRVDVQQSSSVSAFHWDGRRIVTEGLLMPGHAVTASTTLIQSSDRMIRESDEAKKPLGKA